MVTDWGLKKREGLVEGAAPIKYIMTRGYFPAHNHVEAVDLAELPVLLFIINIINMALSSGVWGTGGYHFIVNHMPTNWIDHIFGEEGEGQSPKVTMDYQVGVVECVGGRSSTTVVGIFGFLLVGGKSVEEAAVFGDLVGTARARVRWWTAKATGV